MISAIKYSRVTYEALCFPRKTLSYASVFFRPTNDKGYLLYREEGVQKKDGARIKLESPTESFRAAQKRGGWSLRQDRTRATRTRP